MLEHWMRTWRLLYMQYAEGTWRCTKCTVRRIPFTHPRRNCMNLDEAVAHVCGAFAEFTNEHTNPTPLTYRSPRHKETVTIFRLICL